MLHDINHRDELERLHDRHKRLTLEAYEHLNSNEEDKMIKAHLKMKEAEKELRDFKKKIFSK